MIELEPTIFKRLTHKNPKQLIKAVFIYLFAKHYNWTYNKYNLIDAYDSEYAVLLLCQIYELQPKYIIDDYLNNERLNKYLSVYLKEQNLDEIKNILYTNCIELNDELGDWLFEIMGLIDDEKYFNAPLLRSKKNTLRKYTEKYDGARTDLELFGDYLFEASEFLLPIFNFYDLQMGFGHEIYGNTPFVFEVKTIKQIENMEVFIFEKTAGLSTSYGFVPFSRKDAQEVLVTPIQKGAYIDQLRISVSSSLRAYELCKDYDNQFLIIKNIFTNQLSRNYFLLAEYMSESKVEYVVEHEIGHLKTDKLFSEYFVKYPGIKHTNYLIEEFLADWYAIMSMFSINVNEIKKNCLLISHINYIKNIDKVYAENIQDWEGDERFITVRIRSFLDKNPAKYVDKFKNELEQQLLNEKEDIEKWILDYQRNVIKEIIELCSH